MREGETYGKLCMVCKPVGFVVAVMVSVSTSPLIRVAVTVIEYSVPSSRPVSVYIVIIPIYDPLPSPVVLKQSVLVLEYDMVNVSAVNPLARLHDMVRDVEFDDWNDMNRASTKLTGFITSITVTCHCITYLQYDQ